MQLTSKSAPENVLNFYCIDMRKGFMFLAMYNKDTSASFFLIHMDNWGLKKF